MAPQLLCAVARFISPPEHFVVRVADQAAAQSSEVQAILRERRKTFNPFLAAFAITDASASFLTSVSPFLAGLKREKRLTIYHCNQLACELPKALE
jgi:hypothetical protein